MSLPKVYEQLLQIPSVFKGSGNRWLLVVVLVLGASICGCNKSGTDQAKADGKKQKDVNDSDPPKKTAGENQGNNTLTNLQGMIVGRWEGPEYKGYPFAVEFTAFGTLINEYPHVGSGKYLVKDNGELHMEFQNEQQSTTERCKATIQNGQLTVADVEGTAKEEALLMPGSYKKVSKFSRTPKELILGKWDNRQNTFSDGYVDWEFSRDGTFFGRARKHGQGWYGQGRYKLSGVDLRLVITKTPFLDWKEKNDEDKTIRTTIVVSENKLFIHGNIIIRGRGYLDLKTFANVDREEVIVLCGVELFRVRDKSEQK